MVPRRKTDRRQFSRPKVRDDMMRQGLLAGDSGLQECAGRQLDVCTADADAGCRALRNKSPWRVSRTSRCSSASFASRAESFGASEPDPRTSMSMPPSVAVAWISSGLFTGSSICAMAHGCRQRAIKRGTENGAAIDRHNVMGLRGCEADVENFVAPRLA